MTSMLPNKELLVKRKKLSKNRRSRKRRHLKRNKRSRRRLRRRGSRSWL
jgi:hypothetical protein